MANKTGNIFQVKNHHLMPQKRQFVVLHGVPTSTNTTPRKRIRWMLYCFVVRYTIQYTLYTLYTIQTTVYTLHSIHITQYTLYSIYRIISKTKKFGCGVRGDLTFLFKSCEIDKSQGRLV